MTQGKSSVSSTCWSRHIMQNYSLCFAILIRNVRQYLHHYHIYKFLITRTTLDTCWNCYILWNSASSSMHICNWIGSKRWPSYFEHKKRRSSYETRSIQFDTFFYHLLNSILSIFMKTTILWILASIPFLTWYFAMQNFKKNIYRNYACFHT